jgi:hypothetical protein
MILVSHIRFALSIGLLTYALLKNNDPMTEPRMLVERSAAQALLVVAPHMTNNSRLGPAFHGADCGPSGPRSFGPIGGGQLQNQQP